MNQKILKNILFLIFVCIFLFLFSGKAVADGQIMIAATIGEQDFSFPVGLDVSDGAKGNMDFEIVWLNSDKSIVGRKVKSIKGLGNGVDYYDLQVKPPDKASVVQFNVSGNTGNINHFWSSSIEFNTVNSEVSCGNSVCEEGENLGNCFKDCTDVSEIVWKQFPIKNQWQSDRNIYGGEGMQMVMDIDWNEHNTNILYLVVDTMKVWKSEDGGSFWFPVAKNMKNIGGISIVSDPNNEKVVYMAGSMCSNYTNSQYDGIYRSVDGGVTWDGPTIGTMHYQQRHAGKLFIIDHTSLNGRKSQIVYAGTPHGFYKSNNAGVTWEQIALSGYDIYGLSWSRNNRNYLYIATNKGLYKLNVSNNKTVRIGNNLPNKIWDVEVDANDENILYVALGKSGVQKSTDGGNTFFEVMKGMEWGLNYQRLSINQDDPQTIFASPHEWGGKYPFRSTNGGASWQNTSKTYSNEWIGEDYYYAKPIVFHPDDKKIAISHTDGPIIKTTDGGKTWHYSGNGYTGARVRDIDFIDKNKMLFCLLDYGVLYTENGGKSFSDLALPRVYGSKSCGSVDSNGSTIISSSGMWSSQDIMMSNDMGKKWNKVLSAKEDFDFIRYNSENKNIIYADTWISHNGGWVWQKVSDGYEIRTMDPRNGNRIIGIKKINNSSWKIALSNNAGKDWEQLGGQIDSIDIGDISIDPFSDHLHLFVASGDRMLYEFRNDRWKKLGEAQGFLKGEAQGIHYVQFDFLQKGIVWAAERGSSNHGYGTYVSRDGGINWSYVKSNLGKYSNVYNLDISPFDSTVYKVGQGMWTYSMSMCNYNGVCDNAENSENCSSDCHAVKIQNDSRLKITIFSNENSSFYNESVVLLNNSGYQRLNYETRDRYLSVVSKTNQSLSDLEKYNIATFINKGTESSMELGSGERAAVLNSYFSAFSKLPREHHEWEDIIKISNGRWPGESNINAERRALTIFRKIYKRDPRFSNQYDESAIKIIAYGLRPRQRNLNSEKLAILSFKNIFKRSPSSAIDWDTVRAISYSGAKR